jgi:lipopolysaccharide biosynthesis regulator YciM
MSLGTPWMLLLLPLVALSGWLMARATKKRPGVACPVAALGSELH